MNGSEKSLWRWLSNDQWVKAQSRKVLQMNRVENVAGSGMPDVEGIYLKEQFWFELKVAGRPARGGNVDVKHMRPKQVEWLHNRWLAGGNAWVLLRVKDALYLIPGKYSLQVKHGLTEDELFDLSKAPPDAAPQELLDIAVRH